ncbi:ribosome assembly factor SBDS [archaeon]|nr:ribosome assembly factor SBDS [archaeon]
MTNTTARITKKGQHFEILVDLEEALKVRRGEGNINGAILTESIFTNLKSGDIASRDLLEVEFGSSDVAVVGEKIIKNGEVVLPVDYKNEEQDKRYKQVVNFLVKNSVSPEGRPYTPDRIMSALKEAHVNVKNKPVDAQIEEILAQIQKILPIKIEMKKVRVTIPAIHSGKAYGVVSDWKQDEEWLSNGDVIVTVSVPAGLIMDFYDKLNGVTHGSALTEEVRG